MKQVKRTFTPGSEWIYFKIYAGSKTLDNILLQDISYIVNKLNKLSIIEKWFFIRYADPDSHIRVRFLINNSKHIGEVITLLHQRLEYLIKSNSVWKIQLDTYRRELERYGYNTIEETEQIFYKDSECILDILKLIKKFQNENYRWMIALTMIDSLLSDFSFNMESKFQLMETMSCSFMLEFGFNKFNSKQFNSKFRDKKNIIESVLNNEIKDENFHKLSEYVTKKTINLKSTVKQLQIKLVNSKNSQLDSLLQSYIHMMLNRLFISKNRVHELVLYDFMRRYYTSEISKNKYIAKTHA
ncbi:MAG: thiopeptide-type bacteriocin biosynthesis protein [Dysgonomonas sp.]